MKSQYRIALIGEVDAGKSTTLGQILLKTGSVLQNRIDEVDRASRAQNRDFEPAFLLDAFEYERQNEMTVDITSISCRLGDLDIRFLDTPGHQELSNKFISGSSGADLALLILDSQAETFTEHFRHARMLRALGLKDFAIIVNKWGNRSQQEFHLYLEEIHKFLNLIDLNIHFILPVSAKSGQGFGAESEYSWIQDNLLASLDRTLLSLKEKSTPLIFFKKKVGANFAWAQLEQGELSQDSVLYSERGLFNLSLPFQDAGRFAFIETSDDLPQLITDAPDHIFVAKELKVSIVPLEDDWQECCILRTQWGQVELIGIRSRELLLLKVAFPFFKPNLRANFFTLEKEGRILAVGIPYL